MPLSDRERQILSEIEARLSADDPKFARTVGTTTVSSKARGQVKLAAVGLVVGFVLLFGIIVSVWFGLLGFALMFASALHGGTQLKRMGQDSTARLGGQLRGGFTRYLDGHRKDPQG